MARPLRLELAGGLYHVTARGDRREAIYEDEDDRQAWLEVFAQVCERHLWRCHAWCQMTNHSLNRCGHIWAICRWGWVLSLLIGLGTSAVAQATAVLGPSLPDHSAGVLTPTGVITHRHYFSAMGQAVAVLTTTQSGTNARSNPRWSYWHRDHLGSVAAVTDANGAVQERYAYDPFGKRRFTDGRLDANGTLVADHPDGAELAAGTKLHDTDRGFTGHEHLDDVGIVNMNGRIYDPLLARFMQPDPQLQELYNLQNFNRYSYVLNNPLRYTDPTGEEFFLSLWLAAVASTVASQAISNPELRMVVSIAASVYFGMGGNFAMQGTLTSTQSAARGVLVGDDRFGGRPGGGPQGDGYGDDVCAGG